MKKSVLLIFALMTFILSGCDEPSNTEKDMANTIAVGDKLVSNQPTPNDLNYSLERYNLIRRAYWVNGQREKANMLPCAVVKPLGYVLLFTESGNIVGNFVVDGKITSLNAYLTPDSEYYEGARSHANDAVRSTVNYWLPDVDGAYGENDNGIFFFTPDGKYIEWTGIYLYSDIPFDVKSTLLTIGE